MERTEFQIHRSRAVKEGPGWSGRVHDGLGGFRMVLKGPRQSWRVQDSLGYVQDGLGGTRMVSESPEGLKGSRMVRHVWVGPGLSGRVQESPALLEESGRV